MNPVRHVRTVLQMADRFLIEEVYGREILDSRGRPTVEAEVKLRGGARGRAAVPSGASTGSLEALELRDGDPNRYRGQGVLGAVNNINTEIRRTLIGRDVRQQRTLDDVLRDLDGSDDKSRLGANAILAVSLAMAHAAADGADLSLYKYIGEIFRGPAGQLERFLLPVPMLNFINGGAHADNALDFQEFMLVPHGAPTFEEALKWASRVYLGLLRAVRSHSGNTFQSFGVGDEGGFSITTPSELGAEGTVRFVLDLLTKFVEGEGYSVGREGQFAIALDPAASEFYRDGAYVMGRRQTQLKPEVWDSGRLVSFYERLVAEYPIVSIEDGMAEHDVVGWKELTRRLGDNCQIVGDDLFVTNPEVFQRGIDAGLGNAILVKVNQIGTLSEALEVVRLAQHNGYRAIVSHRSGETEDTTISDIAVAVNAGQIKTGCLSRADRAAKYNRLLEISHELGEYANFNGRMATPARRKPAA